MRKIISQFDIRLQVKAILLLLVSMFIVLTIASYYSISTMITSSKSVKDKSFEKLRVISLLRIELNGTSSDLRKITVTNSNKSLEKEKIELLDKVKLLDLGFKDIKPYMVGNEIGELSKAVSRWTSIKEEIVRYLQELNSIENNKPNISINNNIETAIADVSVNLSTLARSIDVRVDKSIQEAITKSEALLLLIVVLSIFSLFLSVLFGLFISRNINKGLSSAVEQSKSIVEGDFIFRTSYVPNDEFGAMIQNMISASQELNSIIYQLKSDVSKMKGVSNRLLDSSDKTLASTGRQKLNLESVVSSIDELAATFSEIAENTKIISDRFNSMSLESEIGKKVMNETISEINMLVDAVQDSNTTISVVEEEAKNIDQVLQVIRSVAEQTNLLALNAAIEAARAGESGRGFSVVADEVRSLAIRTHDSALEIQSMTEGLRQRISTAGNQADVASERAQLAVNQAEETQDKFSNIITLISELNDRMVYTASTTEQQAAVAEEIMRNVSALSDMAAETELACKMNSEEGHNLDDLVSSIELQISDLKVSK